MMNIADRIQSLRKQKGMSQIELADAIGVSRQAVSKWESEQAIPDLDKIIAMSEIFGTTTDYLLKGIEPIEGDPDAPVAPKPKMSKEESLALAEKLTHEYKALEKLRTQISDNETIIKRPVDGSYARHAAFKFFWPFFIYAVLSYILMLIITAIFVGGTRGDGVVFVILCYAVPIGVLIAGGVYACRKRDILNAEASELARARRDNADKLRKETEEMKSKLKTLETRVSKMDSAIPSQHKNSGHMAKAKTLIEAGKADSLEDALALCEAKK
jgi:transcriptional regulator with XRE-family HTH domain